VVASPLVSPDASAHASRRRPSMGIGVPGSRPHLLPSPISSRRAPARRGRATASGTSSKPRRVRPSDQHRLRPVLATVRTVIASSRPPFAARCARRRRPAALVDTARCPRGDVGLVGTSALLAAASLSPGTTPTRSLRLSRVRPSARARAPVRSVRIADFRDGWTFEPPTLRPYATGLDRVSSASWSSVPTRSRL
jgi:hypothetical protein